MSGRQHGSEQDILQRFSFTKLPLRGEIVRIDESLGEILAQHFYPDPVTRMLGEALAASVLLASTLKFQGTLSIQSRGRGALAVLFAECSHDRRIRGYARLGEQAAGESSTLLADGTLAITITPDEGQRYQGIVPVNGATLAECLEHYFMQSEQLPTLLRLACDGRQAAGILIQQMPAKATPDVDLASTWDELTHIVATLRGTELLEKPFSTVLYQLFHQYQVRVQAGEAVRFGCRCSRSRAALTLQGVGEAEVRSLLAEQGRITIHCEFCQQEYLFDEAAVSALFPAGDGATRH